MSWDEIYGRMCFSHYKGELIEGNKIKDALVTLEQYLQGQARAYEVHDALDVLAHIFGDSVAMAATSLREAILLEDEAARMVTAQQCVMEISRAVSRRGGAWGSLNALG